MADATIARDPAADPLLAPGNCVLALIDYQPEQYAGVTSENVEVLGEHVVMLAKTAMAFGVPVVLSTVYVRHGMQGTVPELTEVLPGVEEIDRTTMNSWEDPEFRSAVLKTGRRKLILAGLWTEVCVAFPALDALREGFEVFVVEDAIGGVSATAHKAAMQRMVEAGAVPVTVLALACELQRDWGRPGADRLRGVMREYFQRSRSRRDRTLANSP